ncbi:hypothetical protein J2741_001762 [Methanolinea mesophila]|uniref:COG1361 S-layer family protein n=1 Tax=Methanolinea mesophila TaxID=547055 RepID=UPI001AEAD1EE|nr:hypothetical protein [Methanolinea mesophila]MBP1929215.1 hypothetical protein [Methanolinea mesophila]
MVITPLNRKNSRIFLIFFLIAACACTAVASAASTSDDIASSQVAVTAISLDPEILMQDDTGMITVEVQNFGSSSVPLYRATLMTDTNLKLQNQGTYDSLGSLGAGTTMKFTFTVNADTWDGIYYPRFQLDYSDPSADGLRYSIPVQVESTGIEVSVLDAPDSFSDGKKGAITLLIGNPRENTVHGITVTPQGDGITSTQRSIFVGDLKPGESRNVTFDITPSQETELTFNVNYKNGINAHNATVSLPVTFGEDKMGADMVISGIEVSRSGAGYSMSGDVSNVGLSDAKSVIVMVDSPAVPIDPDRVSVIGALEPDDFSSFDLTFNAQGVSSIPVIVQYKDEDGNLYEEKTQVSLNSMSASTGTGSGTFQSGQAVQDGQPPGGARTGPFTFGRGVNSIPWLEIVLAVIVAVGIVVAWRKGVFGKIKGRIRK